MAPGPWHAAPAEADDGWVGTRELPGYRAGPVVVKLADLPMVDAEHLYWHDGEITLAYPRAPIAVAEAMESDRAALLRLAEG